MVNTCIILIISITYRRLTILTMTFKIAVSLQYHKIDAMLLALMTVVHIGSQLQWSRCSAEKHVDERSWSPSRLFFIHHLSLLMSDGIMLFPPSPKQDSPLLLILLTLFSFVLPVFLLCVWEDVLPVVSPLCLLCPCLATFVTWMPPTCSYACLCPFDIHLDHILR